MCCCKLLHRLINFAADTSELLREKTGRSLLVLPVLTCVSAHQHAHTFEYYNKDLEKFKLEPHI
jgi:hypothetical protein